MAAHVELFNTVFSHMSFAGWQLGGRRKGRDAQAVKQKQTSGVSTAGETPLSLALEKTEDTLKANLHVIKSFFILS